MAIEFPCSTPATMKDVPALPDDLELARREPKPSSLSPWWKMQRSDDCVFATAIHDGTELRSEVAEAMVLAHAERYREEDPFTGHAILDVPTHIIPRRSRFEIDLNREETEAVYQLPEHSWGLKVWRSPPCQKMVERSRRMHRAFYAMLGQLTDELAEAHGRFVVLDVHSYNHRRGGALAQPASPEEAPDVNIGTFSMPRAHWAFLIDPLMAKMSEFDFGGRRLDVRENVAFQGRGQLTRYVHERHPQAGCAIAIEFKKFYMDEWSGAPDVRVLGLMRAFMRHAADTCRDLLNG